MTKIIEKQREITEQEPRTIVIKSINITEAKHSINLVYRKDKEGKPTVTGFEVKVYGDKANIMSSKTDQLIKYGLERMTQPIPKD